MDREIKFRAWNGERMLFSDNGDFYLMPNNHVDIPSLSGHEFYRKHYPIMQYTGLKDRNGKEIYEGDVVFVDCSSVAGSFEDGTYKVEYLVPDCMFALIQMDNKNGITFNECYLYEVIGNIHENPELL